jgi:hypothetical protein
MTTRQQHADLALASWQLQARAGIPASERILPDDVGGATCCLREDANAIVDVWLHHPERRAEFGRLEVKDLAEVYTGLGALLQMVGT